MKFKRRLLNAAFLLCTAGTLGGCAGLNDGLAQLNGALSELNGALGTGSAPPAGKSVKLADRSTTAYALRNLEVAEVPFAHGRGYKLTGQAYNKTGKRMRLTLTMPMSGNGGFEAGSLLDEVYLEPHGKARIEMTTRSAVPDGGRLNTAKFRVNVEVFR